MSAKPELGPVKAGDKVIVISGSRRGSHREAVVTKAARVWLDLVETDDSTYPMTWRMRRDTQTDGGKYGSPTRFVTPEQLAWEEAERLADDFLKEAGIELRWSRSRYWTNKVTLANLIRKHEGLPEL
jgi:hypothetical protein